ncbi:hypothetical protein [Pelagibacterium lentulum]|uniref:Uncharacterized protein n=1 Tax=Pelagibacterium lentulum TaxID=2029865 RepID=A0A916RPB3_9HYPH|nr:hypothetical protein [Pelagibacterium lentulum]GGA63673.1 hypothetical protein GCM10011499_37540 [Pelagibacterium lentulum]
MSRRPRQKQPVTAADVERALDKLAWVMSRSRNPGLGAPLWKRLESELERLREEEAIVAAAQARLKRSKDRTAALSA